MHQAFTRAHVKLCFALGLGHLMATTTGTVSFDHVQEKLGELWIMSELARSAIVAAEAGAAVDEGGVLLPGPAAVRRAAGRDAEVAAAGRTRCCQLIGGGSLMATPVARRRRGAAGRADRHLLPGRRRRRDAPHPPVPARLGLHRLRSRRSRRALRALLPLGLLPDDRARLRDRRQVVPGGARRAVPARLSRAGIGCRRGTDRCAGRPGPEIATHDSNRNGGAQRWPRP